MKSTLIKWSVLILLLIGSFVGGYSVKQTKLKSLPNASDSVFEQIDTVIHNRELFRDSIIKRKVYVVDSIRSESDKIKTSFINTNDSVRQLYIDSILKVAIKPKKYNLSDSQAIKVIDLVAENKLCKETSKIDSSNIKNCDEVVSKIDTLTDTLKVSVKEDTKEAYSEGMWNGIKYTGIGSAALLLLLMFTK